MPRKRTPADTCAGKLVLAIQKVLAEQYGDMDRYYFAEAVMNRAHALQGAIIQGNLAELLGGSTVAAYLRPDWLLGNDGVEIWLQKLQSAVTESGTSRSGR